MADEGRQSNEGDGTRSTHRESAEPDSATSRDLVEAEARTPAGSDTADEYRRLEDRQAKTQFQRRKKGLNALKRATELFAGLPAPVDDRIRTYVSELPQWFGHPERIEAEIRVGEDVFGTDGFRRTTDPLTARATTRTGTAVSITVACTSEGPDSGRETWLPTDGELLEELVGLITGGVERWEIDSLSHFADGVVAFDEELTCTYMNEYAEELLGRDTEEFCAESLLKLYPAAVDRGEDTIRNVLETQTSTSISGYFPQRDTWIEATIHPSETGGILVFHETSDSKVADGTLDQILETAPVGIVLLSADGEITRANGRAETLLGLSRGKMDGKKYDDPDWDIWDEAGNPIREADHPVSHVLSTGETVQGFTHGITLPDGTERWLSSNVAPVTGGDGSIEQVIVALEDITESGRLEQLIEALQPVDHILNNATAEEETEQAICELLTETREYQYARISEHVPGTALSESDILEQSQGVAMKQPVTGPIRSPTELAPAQAAVDTAEIQVVTRTEPVSRLERWRAHVLEQGFQAGAIVPLTHRGRVHGLLVLYTDRGEAFGPRERTLLTTLGERIGQVFHSLATERILHAEEVAELTFESTDSASFFISASDELGCTIEIIDTVPAADETLLHYASVVDTSLDALTEFAATQDQAVQLREIHRTETPPGGEVEIELHRRSLAQTLVTEGAVVTADTVSDGRAEVVCKAPLGTDIGSLVTRVHESFPDTSLVSKREYKPAAKADAQAVGRVLGELFETELTDRQQQVLRAALYGGYFHSPRRSTATEIADALSLTQSTFSYHLRNAQQTLFERMFDRLRL